MSDPAPHRTSALRWLRLVSRILLVTFCLVVATITFWPGPPDPDGQQALHEFLIEAYTRGLPTWITFGKIEFGANILMFIPIGLFGALSLSRLRWLIIPAAIAGSAAIEIVQNVAMPERVGSARDVVANGLGAALGYLLSCLVVVLILGSARRRDALPTGRPAENAPSSKELPDAGALVTARSKAGGAGQPDPNTAKGSAV